MVSLIKKNIPWQNCIAFGCDNATVMTGKHKGVAKYVKEKQSDSFIMGCYCHLLHIAAQNAASKLPYSVDELLIDIYYYLNKSTKRQQALKSFQALCGIEMRKMIKHSVTRWLSLEKCISRLLEQWLPLQEFFKKENEPNNKFVDRYKSLPSDCSTSSAKAVSKNIVQKTKAMKRKMNQQQLLISKRPKLQQNVSPEQKMLPKQRIDEKIEIEAKVPPKETKTAQPNQVKVSKVPKKPKATQPKNRLDRVNFFLQNPEVKLYCLFLKNALPMFTKVNEFLQSSIPLIHKLRRVLLELLSDIYSRFLKATAVSSAKDILSVDMKEKKNYRDNDTIVIGSETKALLKTLKSLSDEDVKFFYRKVKDFYVTAASYIIQKFNLSSPLLECAEVADIEIRENVPYSHVKFFLSKFPHFFDESELDVVESQFLRYQIEKFNEDIINCNRVDVQWYKISQMKDTSGKLKYNLLWKVIQIVLVIPHSNAEDERIFSVVRKNLNEYRPNLSSDTLSDLMVEKMSMLSKNEKCYESNFSKELTTKLKSATYNSLK